MYNYYIMSKLFKSLILVSVLILSGCGYDGTYRYHCQDPVNWENTECNPPVCIVEGYCTKDLIGFDWRNNPENLQYDDLIEEEEGFDE
jgi:hypothetical protein